jgi:hypothetical protein
MAYLSEKHTLLIVGEALTKRIGVVETAVGRQGASQTGAYEDYFRWQYGSSPHQCSKYKVLRLRSRASPKVDNGIGGRTAWLASQGTTRAVDIDITADESALAAQRGATAYCSAAPRVEYRRSAEDRLLELRLTGLILLLWHDRMVSPCRLSHGSLPVLQLSSVSDEIILDAVRWRVSWPDYKPTRFESVPPVERWRGIYDLKDRPKRALEQEHDKADETVDAIHYSWLSRDECVWGLVPVPCGLFDS